MRLSCLALVLVAAACTAGDSSAPDRPSARACLALRDHVVDLRLAAVTDHRAEHAAHLAAALGRTFVDDCVASVSPAQLRGARTATDLDALTACAPR